jgi:hypothetical protein
MTLKDAQGCVGPGWAKLIEQGFNLCLKRGAGIIQIKEKFGGLRFYCDIDGTDEFLQLNLMEKSYTICEECGRPGEERPGGWVKTLCDDCAEVRYRRRERNWQ